MSGIKIPKRCPDCGHMCLHWVLIRKEMKIKRLSREDIIRNQDEIMKTLPNK